MKKIEGLPEGARKIILWSLIAVLAAVLLYFYSGIFIGKLRGLSEDNLKETLKLDQLIK
ncbi:MAG: hypothetical protein HYW70_03710 [Candidatus Nealsonbacteria bacterium]|nr:hypothetical protein [Candidatus Nealsonbacteria bacterium]